ncbi:MAG: helix-turn-helix transcriptional regulator [Victivallales bacterium]|nr:helix-turn-helix transcriptional regulator [Victivallales bacterium]
MPEHDTIEIGHTRLEIIICGRAKVDTWNYTEEMLQVPFWRLYFPLSDNGIIIYQGQEIPLHPGHIYIIAAETPFACRKTEGILDKLVLHFNLDEDFCSCRDRIFDFPADSILTELGNQLSSAIDKNVRGVNSIMNGFAFCSTAITKLPSELFTSLQSVDSDMLEIRRMIQREPCREYKNSDMARIAGISASIFIRRFTAAFGMAPQHYIQKERVNLVLPGASP